MTNFNLIATVVKREHKTMHQSSTIAIYALIPNFSRPEIQRSMTGTREWEYIKYPKPIVSLKNFSRNKTLNKCNNKHTKHKCYVIKYILLISLFKNITNTLNNIT